MVPRIIKEIESEMSGSVKINEKFVVIQEGATDDQCKPLFSYSFSF